MRYARTRSSALAVVVLGGLCVVSAACQNPPAAPSNYAPFSVTELAIGTGTAAANGNVLTVSYTGWIYDGAKADLKGPVFTSSLGGDNFAFTLGTSEVIEGWDKGLVGMQVGGRRRLVIPPSLAYGGTRVSSIPPNCTLVFEIDLLGLQ